jgi:lycopene cyclase domain-containing protein
MEKYLYLSLMLFSISYPLAQSFEHRITYYRQWKYLFPAIAITAFVFIVWDHWFTVIGVWEFNPRYVLGLFFLELPLEEWLFFIVVPFASIFIYEVLNYFVKKDILQPIAKATTLFLIPFLFVIGMLNLDKWYTSVNLLVGSVALAIHYIFFQTKYLGRIYLAYLVHLIPFLLVNGVLTGGFTEEAVVIYNNEENLGIRIYTIPIEDTVYAMTLLLMNISFYEKFRQRKTIQTVKSL